MKFLICGSREYGRMDYVHAFLDTIQKTDTVIVGDARGVDREVPIYLTKGRNLLDGPSIEIYKADWSRLGTRAGITRNLEMLDRMPDLIVAFWDGESPGTKFMIDTALKRRMNLRVVFEVP